MEPHSSDRNGGPIAGGVQRAGVDGSIVLRSASVFEGDPEVASLERSAPLPRVEWRFDTPEGQKGERSATRGWQAAQGVSGLTVREGEVGAQFPAPARHARVRAGSEGYGGGTPGWGDQASQKPAMPTKPQMTMSSLPYWPPWCYFSLGCLAS